MQKLGAYIVITIAVFAVVAVAIRGGGPTSANVEESLGPAQGSATAPAQGQTGVGSGETTTHQFVGIGIETLDSAEASELDVAGGAVVRRLLKDGPATGLFLPGDIITAIDGAGVTSARDVVESVGATSPGDTLSFTVLRDGATMDVNVTVGERPVRAKLHHKPAVDLYHRLLNHIWGWQDKLARFEVTIETDDGFKTFTAVVGKASDIDVENGTFVLTPKDGSGPIPYEISTSTKVVVGHTGDLGGLNTEDPTLVVEMDGVKLVLQGDLPIGYLGDKSYHFGPKSGLHGRGKIRPFKFRGPHGQPDFWEFRVPPELRERFEWVPPGGPFQEFEGGQFRVPPGPLERFREIVPAIPALPFERFEGEGPQVFPFAPEVRKLRDGLSQDL